MDKTKLLLSSGLRKVLNLAYEYAVNHKFPTISLDLVQFCIFTAQSSGDGESKIVEGIFNRLSAGEIYNLLKDCEEIVNRKDSCSKSGGILIDSEKKEAALSDEFAVVLDRIIAAREIYKDMASIDEMPVDTDEFFAAAMIQPTDFNSFLKSKYGVSANDILQVITNNLMTLGKTTSLTSHIEDTSSPKEEETKSPEDKKDGEDSEEGRFERAGEKAAISSRRADPNSKTPTLDQFGVDMTQNAKEGQYDPVIGRDKEISQVIEILSCRKKCNAILLGEPGAGKTALVEGLAQKITSGDVPRSLKGRRIISVATTDLTAGTQFRGQLEERVVNMCNELRDNPNIILYLDEFHQATSENSTSISDMLKPSLSRGEVTVIAATTLDEYKKYVEKDGALKRRFQKVMITEPNGEETYKILKGLAKRYSEFHQVKYTDQVLRACTEYSERYMYDRKSPDRAIDLLDTSGALAKLSAVSDTKELDDLEKKRDAIAELKKKAIDRADFEGAKAYRDEGKEIDAKIEAIKKKAATGKALWPEVTLENVASVISKISGVPVDKIISPELDKIRGMRDDLKKSVIGQDEAIESVVKVLSKSFLGLRNENRPVASLLFTGPSGVGKTLIAEKIAETIFGDKKALIRIDMGEYSQSHSVTKLIGSTASFVGYGDKAVLDQVRDRPSCVLLFDEIEKCNQEIIDTIFLNMMDNGMVKMSNGVDVSFRNAIIIFTSNEGTKDLELKGNGIGFGELSSGAKKSVDRSTVLKAIEKKFRPEFRGRLTGITVFNSLGEPEMAKIFDLELSKFKDRLKKKGYSIKVGKKLKDKIVSETDTRYGARDLIKGIGKNIEDEIVEKMLDPSVDLSKKKITVDLVDDKIDVVFE